VDFHSNGNFDYSPGAVIGGRYRVENNRLVTTNDSGDPETIVTIESVTDGLLRLSVDKGGSLDYKRVSRTENPSNPLFGTWVTVAPMQGLPNKVYGYYYFRRDGRETFVVPFLTSHCTYSVTGDRIRLTMPGQGSKEGALRWEGDVLMLPWGGQVRTILTRDPSGMPVVLAGSPIVQPDICFWLCC